MVLKLPKILNNPPSGALITSTFLSENGISRQLVQSYIKSGWLERLHPGVFKRPLQSYSWQGGVYALQKQLRLSIHIASHSALELHNIRHQVSLSDEEIFLAGTPETKLPRWFERVWKDRVFYTRSHLFSKRAGIEPVIAQGFELCASTPERAFLEVLSNVNNDHTFEDASNLLSGYLSWNVPHTLELLGSCQSRKARRLLLFFGKYHDIDALQEVAASKPDLGKGKIQIVERGRFNLDFQITVPEQFQYDGGAIF